MGGPALVLNKMNIFFYGTLRHVPLLKVVLGECAHLELSEAVLSDYSVFSADGGIYPVIQPHIGASSSGLLVRGVTSGDIERLQFYEGGFGYLRRSVNVDADGVSVPAEIFVPDAADVATGAPWSMADWESQWAAVSLLAADEIMDGFGNVSPAVISARFPQIMQRAASFVRASQKSSPSGVRAGLGRTGVSVLDTRRPYTNFFSIKEQEVSFQRFDGTVSETVTRAAFVGGDAVTVLPFDPVRDCVMIIEQFRFGIFARGDNSPWSLEPIAGRIDAGETPEQTAHREVWEEAGLSLKGLLPVAQYYPSAGAVTDFLYSFIGLADLPPEAVGIGGLQSEAEDIKSHVLPFSALMSLISSGEVEDGQLILSALWLSRHRDEIRCNA